MKVVVKSLLKEVRVQKNVSLRQLAEISGVSKSHISEIENNTSIPTLYAICALAVALEVKPEELYTFEVVEK